MTTISHEKLVIEYLIRKGKTRENELVRKLKVNVKVLSNMVTKGHITCSKSYYKLSKQTINNLVDNSINTEAIEKLKKSLELLENIQQKLETIVDLYHDEHQISSDMTRAYNALFTTIAEKNNWYCVAQCCDSPFSHQLVRLNDCNHFVCMNYVNDQFIKKRSTVQTSNEPVSPTVICPLCNKSQNFHIFLPAIPYRSNTSPVPFKWIDTKYYRTLIDNIKNNDNNSSIYDSDSSDSYSSDSDSDY